MAKKDVVGLAKSGTKKPAAKTTSRPAASKPAPKPAEKKLTAEQERDLKAKETVEKLLGDDSLIVSVDKKEELLVLDEPEAEPKGVEWLEEQLTLLTQSNEALKVENEMLKARLNQSSVSKNDGDVQKVVIDLFNELQENYVRMGVDARGMGNFRIYTPGFLNRMIKFFPFLEQVKRY